MIRFPIKRVYRGQYKGMAFLVIDYYRSATGETKTLAFADDRIVEFVYFLNPRIFGDTIVELYRAPHNACLPNIERNEWQKHE